VTPSEFREDLDIHKTRMNGLSCAEESMTIYSAVLIQCQCVTDGRTDRQTGFQPISITCFSIADARKNHSSAQGQGVLLTLNTIKPAVGSGVARNFLEGVRNCIYIISKQCAYFLIPSLVTAVGLPFHFLQHNYTITYTFAW